MMTIYEVVDGGTDGVNKCYRTKAEALAASEYVDIGHVLRMQIPTPITKDMVINLLNREGYAANQTVIYEFDNTEDDDGDPLYGAE